MHYERFDVTEPSEPLASLAWWGAETCRRIREVAPWRMNLGRIFVAYLEYWKTFTNKYSVIKKKQKGGCVMQTK